MKFGPTSLGYFVGEEPRFYVDHFFISPFVLTCSSLFSYRY